MGNNLQDQLVRAGLADRKQAKKAQVGKKFNKGKKKDLQNPQPSESTQAAQQAMAQKAARDRELNRQREAEAQRKAVAAQIQQLIEQNRLPRDEAEVAYQFEDGGKIHKIYVTPTMHKQLGDDRLSIVKLKDRYELVPAEIAEKILARDPRCVVTRNTTEPEVAEDDPYADYKVPDDLMW